MLLLHRKAHVAVAPIPWSPLTNNAVRPNTRNRHQNSFVTSEFLMLGTNSQLEQGRDQPMSGSTDGKLVHLTDSNNPMVLSEAFVSVIKGLEASLQISLNLPTLRSCRWKGTDLTIHNVCDQAGSEQKNQRPKTVVYYNRFSQERIICGRSIPPNTHLQLDELCKEPSRLYAVLPDRTAKGLPPTTVRFNDPQRRKSATEFQPCDVPCFHAGEYRLVSQRTIDGTPWRFVFSMEGPHYFPSLFLDRSAYQIDRYYATTSFQSDVPLPYFSWSEYSIQKPMLDFDQAIPAALFLAQNCDSRNDREGIVRALRTSFRVDSLSSCLHNAEPPAGVDMDNKIQIQRHYLFYLAFENQNEDDYITEKLWSALESGTLPIYFGAPNVLEHVPENSVINVNDFDSIDALAAYLTKVSKDRALYELHHAWRLQPLPGAFHRKYDFTNVHGTCRMCRWAVAKRYGWGWNHANQTIVDVAVPRTICVDERGLLQQPLQESWTLKMNDVDTKLQPPKIRFQQESAKVKDSCNVGRDTATIVVGEKEDVFERLIVEQDGVLDIYLRMRTSVKSVRTSRESALLWQFRTPLQHGNATTFVFQTIEEGHMRLQDSTNRITFLTWPRVNVALASFVDGGDHRVIVQVPILPLLRLRVIVEDVDTFHPGAAALENYFGKTMKADFWNPVETFV
jgi:hypothetical protein